MSIFYSDEELNDFNVAQINKNQEKIDYLDDELFDQSREKIDSNIFDISNSSELSSDEKINLFKNLANDNSEFLKSSQERNDIDGSTRFLDDSTSAAKKLNDTLTQFSKERQKDESVNRFSLSSSVTDEIDGDRIVLEDQQRSGKFGLEVIKKDLGNKILDYLVNNQEEPLSVNDELYKGYDQDAIIAAENMVSQIASDPEFNIKSRKDAIFAIEDLFGKDKKLKNIDGVGILSGNKFLLDGDDSIKLSDKLSKLKTSDDVIELAKQYAEGPKDQYLALVLGFDTIKNTNLQLAKNFVEQQQFENRDNQLIAESLLSLADYTAKGELSESIEDKEKSLNRELTEQEYIQEVSNYLEDRKNQGFISDGFELGKELINGAFRAALDFSDGIQALTLGNATGAENRLIKRNEIRKEANRIRENFGWSDSFKFSNEAAAVIGEVLPDVAIGLATFGGGSAVKASAAAATKSWMKRRLSKIASNKAALTSGVFSGTSAYGAIIPEHIDQYMRSGYNQSEAFSKARVSAILPALSEGVASYLLNGIVKRMPDEFDTKANINNLSLNDIAIIDKTYGWKKFLKEVAPKQGVRETIKALEVSSDDLAKTFSKRAISSSAARKEWIKRNATLVNSEGLEEGISDFLGQLTGQGSIDLLGGEGEISLKELITGFAHSYALGGIAGQSINAFSSINTLRKIGSSKAFTSPLIDSSKIKKNNSPESNAPQEDGREPVQSLPDPDPESMFLQSDGTPFDNRDFAELEAILEYGLSRSEAEKEVISVNGGYAIRKSFSQSTQSSTKKDSNVPQEEGAETNEFFKNELTSIPTENLSRKKLKNAIDIAAAIHDKNIPTEVNGKLNSDFSGDLNSYDEYESEIIALEKIVVDEFKNGAGIDSVTAEKALSAIEENKKIAKDYYANNKIENSEVQKNSNEPQSNEDISDNVNSILNNDNQSNDTLSSNDNDNTGSSVSSNTSTTSKATETNTKKNAVDDATLETKKSQINKIDLVNSVKSNNSFTGLIEGVSNEVIEEAFKKESSTQAYQYIVNNSDNISQLQSQIDKESISNLNSLKDNVDKIFKDVSDSKESNENQEEFVDDIFSEGSSFLTEQQDQVAPEPNKPEKTVLSLGSEKLYRSIKSQSNSYKDEDKSKLNEVIKYLDNDLNSLNLYTGLLQFRDENPKFNGKISTTFKPDSPVYRWDSNEKKFFINPIKLAERMQLNGITSPQGVVDIISGKNKGTSKRTSFKPSIGQISSESLGPSKEILWVKKDERSGQWSLVGVNTSDYLKSIRQSTLNEDGLITEENIVDYIESALGKDQGFNGNVNINITDKDSPSAGIKPKTEKVYTFKYQKFDENGKASFVEKELNENDFISFIDRERSRAKEIISKTEDESLIKKIEKELNQLNNVESEVKVTIDFNINTKKLFNVAENTKSPQLYLSSVIQEELMHVATISQFSDSLYRLDGAKADKTIKNIADSLLNNPEYKSILEERYPSLDLNDTSDSNKVKIAFEWVAIAAQLSINGTSTLTWRKLKDSKLTSLYDKDVVDEINANKASYSFSETVSLALGAFKSALKMRRLIASDPILVDTVANVIQQIGRWNVSNLDIKSSALNTDSESNQFSKQWLKELETASNLDPSIKFSLINTEILFDDEKKINPATGEEFTEEDIKSYNESNNDKIILNEVISTISENNLQNQDEAFEELYNKLLSSGISKEESLRLIGSIDSDGNFNSLRSWEVNKMIEDKIISNKSNSIIKSFFFNSEDVKFYPKKEVYESMGIEVPDSSLPDPLNMDLSNTSSLKDVISISDFLLGEDEFASLIKDVDDFDAFNKIYNNYLTKNILSFSDSFLSLSSEGDMNPLNLQKLIQSESFNPLQAEIIINELNLREDFLNKSLQLSEANDSGIKSIDPFNQMGLLGPDRNNRSTQDYSEYLKESISFVKDFINDSANGNIDIVDKSLNGKKAALLFYDINKKINFRNSVISNVSSLIEKAYESESSGRVELPDKYEVSFNSKAKNIAESKLSSFIYKNGKKKDGRISYEEFEQKMLIKNYANVFLDKQRLTDSKGNPTSESGLTKDEVGELIEEGNTVVKMPLSLTEGVLSNSDGNDIFITIPLNKDKFNDDLSKLFDQIPDQFEIQKTTEKFSISTVINLAKLVEPEKYSDIRGEYLTKNPLIKTLKLDTKGLTMKRAVSLLSKLTDKESSQNDAPFKNLINKVYRIGLDSLTSSGFINPTFESIMDTGWSIAKGERSSQDELVGAFSLNEDSLDFNGFGDIDKYQSWKRKPKYNKTNSEINSVLAFIGNDFNVDKTLEFINSTPASEVDARIAVLVDEKIKQEEGDRSDVDFLKTLTIDNTLNGISNFKLSSKIPKSAVIQNEDGSYSLTDEQKSFLNKKANETSEDKINRLNAEEYESILSNERKRVANSISSANDMNIIADLFARNAEQLASTPQGIQDSNGDKSLSGIYYSSKSPIQLITTSGQIQNLSGGASIGVDYTGLVPEDIPTIIYDAGKLNEYLKSKSITSKSNFSLTDAALDKNDFNFGPYESIFQSGMVRDMNGKPLALILETKDFSDVDGRFSFLKNQFDLLGPEAISKIAANNSKIGSAIDEFSSFLNMAMTGFRETDNFTSKTLFKKYSNDPFVYYLNKLKSSPKIKSIDSFKSISKDILTGRSNLITSGKISKKAIQDLSKVVNIIDSMSFSYFGNEASSKMLLDEHDRIAKNQIKELEKLLSDLRSDGKPDKVAQNILISRIEVLKSAYKYVKSNVDLTNQSRVTELFALSKDEENQINKSLTVNGLNLSDEIKKINTRFKTSISVVNDLSKGKESATVKQLREPKRDDLKRALKFYGISSNYANKLIKPQRFSDKIEAILSKYNIKESDRTLILNSKSESEVRKALKKYNIKSKSDIDSIVSAKPASSPIEELFLASFNPGDVKKFITFLDKMFDQIDTSKSNEEIESQIDKFADELFNNDNLIDNLKTFERTPFSLDPNERNFTQLTEGEIEQKLFKRLSDEGIDPLFASLGYSDLLASSLESIASGISKKSDEVIDKELSELPISQAIFSDLVARESTPDIGQSISIPSPVNISINVASARIQNLNDLALRVREIGKKAFDISNEIRQDSVLPSTYVEFIDAYNSEDPFRPDRKEKINEESFNFIEKLSSKLDEQYYNVSIATFVDDIASDYNIPYDEAIEIKNDLLIKGGFKNGYALMPPKKWYDILGGVFSPREISRVKYILEKEVFPSDNASADKSFNNDSEALYRIMTNRELSDLLIKTRWFKKMQNAFSNSLNQSDISEASSGRVRKVYSTIINSENFSNQFQFDDSRDQIEENNLNEESENLGQLQDVDDIPLIADETSYTDEPDGLESFLYLVDNAIRQNLGRFSENNLYKDQNAMLFSDQIKKSNRLKKSKSYDNNLKLLQIEDLIEYVDDEFGDTSEASYINVVKPLIEEKLSFRLFDPLRLMTHRYVDGDEDSDLYQMSLLAASNSDFGLAFKVMDEMSLPLPSKIYNEYYNRYKDTLSKSRESKIRKAFYLEEALNSINQSISSFNNGSSELDRIDLNKVNSYLSNKSIDEIKQFVENLSQKGVRYKYSKNVIDKAKEYKKKFGDRLPNKDEINEIKKSFIIKNDSEFNNIESNTKYDESELNDFISLISKENAEVKEFNFILDEQAIEQKVKERIAIEDEEASENIKASVAQGILNGYRQDAKAIRNNYLDNELKGELPKQRHYSVLANIPFDREINSSIPDRRNVSSLAYRAALGSVTSFGASSNVAGNMVGKTLSEAKYEANSVDSSNYYSIYSSNYQNKFKGRNISSESRFIDILNNTGFETDQIIENKDETNISFQGFGYYTNLTTDEKDKSNKIKKVILSNPLLSNLYTYAKNPDLMDDIRSKEPSKIANIISVALRTDDDGAYISTRAASKASEFLTRISNNDLDIRNPLDNYYDLIANVLAEVSYDAISISNKGRSDYRNPKKVAGPLNDNGIAYGFDDVQARVNLAFSKTKTSRDVINNILTGFDLGMSGNDGFYAYKNKKDEQDLKFKKFFENRKEPSQQIDDGITMALLQSVQYSETLSERIGNKPVPFIDQVGAYRVLLEKTIQDYESNLKTPDKTTESFLGSVKTKLYPKLKDQKIKAQKQNYEIAQKSLEILDDVIADFNRNATSSYEGKTIDEQRKQLKKDHDFFSNYLRSALFKNKIEYDIIEFIDRYFSSDVQNNKHRASSISSNEQQTKIKNFVPVSVTSNKSNIKLNNPYSGINPNGLLFGVDYDEKKDRRDFVLNLNAEEVLTRAQSKLLWQENMGFMENMQKRLFFQPTNPYTEKTVEDEEKENYIGTIDEIPLIKQIADDREENIDIADTLSFIESVLSEYKKVYRHERSDNGFEKIVNFWQLTFYAKRLVSLYQPLNQIISPLITNFLSNSAQSIASKGVKGAKDIASLEANSVKEMGSILAGGFQMDSIGLDLRSAKKKAQEANLEKYAPQLFFRSLEGNNLIDRESKGELELTLKSMATQAKEFTLKSFLDYGFTEEDYNSYRKFKKVLKKAGSSTTAIISKWNEEALKLTVSAPDTLTSRSIFYSQYEKITGREFHLEDDKSIDKQAVFDAKARTEDYMGTSAVHEKAIFNKKLDGAVWKSVAKKAAFTFTNTIASIASRGRGNLILAREDEAFEKPEKIRSVVDGMSPITQNLVFQMVKISGLMAISSWIYSLFTGEEEEEVQQTLIDSLNNFSETYVGGALNTNANAKPLSEKIVDALVNSIFEFASVGGSLSNKLTPLVGFASASVVQSTSKNLAENIGANLNLSKRSNEYNTFLGSGVKYFGGVAIETSAVLDDFVTNYSQAKSDEYDMGLLDILNMASSVIALPRESKASIGRKIKRRNKVQIFQNFGARTAGQESEPDLIY